jgi:hypothetical protein
VEKERNENPQYKFIRTYYAQLAFRVCITFT